MEEIGLPEVPEMAEGCIAEILSFCAPEDVCRLSIVSMIFLSAAESDTVWERFIPSDFISNVSFPSKKAQYLTLWDHPTIIDQGRKSFQLDKRTGKKCYMLSARYLSIIWGDDIRYWRWMNLPESRFQEVARLVDVCRFEISGRINTLSLSPNTHYAVFLVFKMINAGGFHLHPAMLSVGIFGGNSNTKNVCLDPNLEDDELDERFQGLQRPCVRSDGWLEIEMGEFFNSGLEDEVEMKVMETWSNWWKQGFYLEGIEVRPKYVFTEVEKETRNKM